MISSDGKRMRYCVIGNIVKERQDADGVIRHGTLSFPGGRKVYISRRLWDDYTVTVLGLNRFKSRYILEKIPLAFLENIRASKTFSPRVSELMANDIEHDDMWWLYTEEDKKRSEEFAQILQCVQSGDADVLKKYTRDVMGRFYGRF